MSDFSVRLYEPNDLEEYSSLYRAVYGASLDKYRFENSHYKNPSFKDRPLIFLACAADGAIVGANSFFPDKITLGSQLAPVVQSGDTMVHPACRGRGIFALLLRESEKVLREMAYVLIFGFANAQSHPWFRRARYTTLQVINSYLRVLSYERYLARKHNSFYWRLAGRAADVLTKYQFWNRKMQYADYHLTKYDENVGALFTPVHGKVQVMKDERYFNWKYADTGDASYRMVVVSNGNKPTAKFIVRETTQENGRHYGKVVDYRFLAPNMEIDSVKALCCLCRHRGFYALSIWQLNANEIGRAWRENHAYPREQGLFLVVKQIVEEPRVPMSLESWRLVPSDADTV